MRDFTLIDLCSQQTALKIYLKRWHPQEILVWIKRYGKVTEQDLPNVFLFQSYMGYNDIFSFNCSGEIEVISSSWIGG
jgi:hypothetical protein